MHGRERPTGRADSAVVGSEQVPNGLNNTLVYEVKETAKSDAGEVDLRWRDLPRFLGFLIEIPNQTCSLLDAAAVAFLLRRHGDRLWPATSPLSTRRVAHSSSSSGASLVKSTNGTSSSANNDASISSTLPARSSFSPMMSPPSENRVLGAGM